MVEMKELDLIQTHNCISRREPMTVSQVTIKLENHIEREKDIDKTVKCIEKNRISRS
jgi:hypothetical protein